MKKVLFVIIVLMFGVGAIAQSKINYIKKDETTVSKPYHGFKNPDRGYETTLSIDEVKTAFNALFTGTDVATINYWWHTQRVSIAELQTYWLNHFSNIFGKSYTSTTELLPYVDRMVLRPWPSHELTIAHFGNSDNKTVFGARNRSMRVPDEQVIDVDGKTVGSNVCLNGAGDPSQIVKQSFLQPVTAGKQNGLSLGLPLTVETKKDNGITPEEELLVKRANFYGSYRRDLGEANNQSSFTVKKQRKPILKTFVGKVTAGSIIITGIYLLARALLSKSAGVGGSPTSPGIPGGPGGDPASNGGGPG